MAAQPPSHMPGKPQTETCSVTQHPVQPIVGTATVVLDACIYGCNLGRDFPQAVNGVFEAKVGKASALFWRQSEPTEAQGASALDFSGIGYQNWCHTIGRQKKHGSPYNKGGILRDNLSTIPQLLVEVRSLGSRMHCCPMLTNPY